MLILREKKWRTRKKWGNAVFMFLVPFVSYFFDNLEFVSGQDNAPVFSNDFNGLCHPSCYCLDTYFDCRRQGLTEFPENFPYWVTKL